MDLRGVGCTLVAGVVSVSRMSSVSPALQGALPWPRTVQQPLFLDSCLGLFLRGVTEAWESMWVTAFVDALGRAPPGRR